MDAQATQTNAREQQIAEAHQCFCTEQAIDRVSQFLIDSGLMVDPHAAQTQAMFLITGERCACRKN